MTNSTLSQVPPPVVPSINEERIVRFGKARYAHAQLILTVYDLGSITLPKTQRNFVRSLKFGDLIGIIQTGTDINTIRLRKIGGDRRV
jgi:hypothetical protein